MRSFLYPAKQQDAYVLTQQPLGRSWLQTLCCLLVLFVFATFPARGQSPCPSGNCTSSDLTVTRVELVAANGGAMPNICPPDGEPIQVKLKVTFDVTSNTRYGFIIIGDVYLNGQKGEKVWQCYPYEYTQGPHTVILDKPFSWPCGSTIELRDVFTAWDNSGPATRVCTYFNSTTGELTNCTAIDPKCKYYGSTESFKVASPLIADFTWGGTCPGNTLYKPIEFTGAATGGNPAYQYSWQVTDVVTNTTVGSGSGLTYIFTPETAHNLSVKLTVTDGSSPTAAIAEKVYPVTVETCCTAPVLTSGPVLQTICAGGTASFSIVHSGGLPDPVIRWEVNANGSGWTTVTNGAPYSNATTATLNISGATAGMNGYQYRAVLQSGACAAVTSTAATLNVSSATAGGSVSPAQTVCTGSAPSALTLSGYTGTVVKWQRSTDNFTNFTDIASTSVTLSAADIGVLTQDTWFRAVVKSGVCDPLNSIPVKISVDPASAGGTVSAPQRICTGSPLVNNLSLSGQVGTVVKWQRSSTQDFSAAVADIASTSATLSSATIGVLTQDTWFRAVVKSGVCAPAYSSPVKITVDPTSVGGSIGSAQTVCSGQQLKTALTLTGNVGSVVRWQVSTDGFNQDIANIEVVSSTLTPAQAGALTQDTWFRAVVKSGECLSVESGAVKITVQQPIGNNSVSGTQTICSATTPVPLTGTTPTGGDGNYEYQWQRSTNGSDFSNISGANDKDYAPGALEQTTQFRRVVKAGSACAESTSAAVTITISAESVVYPLEGSNYCATAETKGIIKLGGSYRGVSYQLVRASDDMKVQAPQVGDGSPITWNDVAAGVYYVEGTGVAPTYCTSKTANAIVHEFDCTVLYTLTQGYYGNKNGKSCLGSTPVYTIMALMDGEELKVGTNKWLKVPATYEGAAKLNSILPGGQTPNGLVNPTACSIMEKDCLKPYLTKQGRLNNVLLSQTFTLSLNARWKEGELLLFPIRSGYLTTQAMTGCHDDAVVVETCSGNTVFSKLMNEKVVNYLGSGATVKDLLQLANDALGGTLAASPHTPSYNDINEAVSVINEAFDEGRRFLDYYSEKHTCEMLFPASVIVEPAYVTATAAPVAAEPEMLTSLTVKAYPNPFTDRVRFDVAVPQAGNGSLELFNLMGQKVATVFQGFIPAGRQQWEASLPVQTASTLVYVLNVDGRKVTGKLFRLSGR